MKRPGSIRLLALLALAMTSLPAARAQVIFGSEVSTENLLAFDGSTLAGVIKGPEPTDVAGLAYDSVNGVLYGVAASNLYTINTTNGAGSLVTALSTGGNPTGLAYDPGLHRLFISDIGSNELYSYALGTSTLSLIGTISGGFSAVEGLGYDPLTGTLFGLADGQDRIITINTTNATAAALPSMLVAGTWRGLDFDPDSGVLFATRTGFNLLTSVDPITGIGTDLGAITGAGSPNFIQGLAVQYTAVPEPAHFTLALAAGGAALLGLRRRRRRA